MASGQAETIAKPATDGTPPDQRLALALETKLEDDFVSPMTAIRGALEILRDFPDIEDAERETFVTIALSECARLERGVSDLAEAVYAAGRMQASLAEAERPNAIEPGVAEEVAARIVFEEAAEIADIDFSDHQFSDSSSVNAFYDVIESLVEASGRDWYFIVNHRNCRIWPEAWVAFAHRGKRIRVNHAKAVIRYVDGDAADRVDAPSDPEIRPSRAAAVAAVAALRDGE